MPRPVLTLILVACLTFLTGLGRQAITDGDEAYYAEAAREMVESGDWLTPHFNYQDRWEKPVLYYWLTATFYLVTGTGEAAARFWSALSGLGLVLLTYAIARDTGWDTRASWLAGAIVATCFGYFAEARLALPDLPLAFCITLTIWQALRATLPDLGQDPRRVRRSASRGGSGPRTRAWLITGFGAGLGFLMKGPVALVVPALVLLPLWWRERRALAISASGVATAGLVFAAIGLPWYAAMLGVHGWAYFDSFFVGDNLERFATDRFVGRTSDGPFFYVPMLLGGLMPWTAYAVAVLIARLTDPARRWRLTSPEWRLVLWAAMPLLFFSLSLGKQPRYILPVLPPVAILVASSLARRLATAGARQPTLAGATWATAALLVVCAVLLARARALFINSPPFLTWVGVALVLVSALRLALLAWRRAWPQVPWTMTGAAVVLLLTMQFGAIAGVRPEAVEQMAALIRTHRTANEPVGVTQVFVRNLVFYTGGRLEKDLDVESGSAARFLQRADRALLVVRARDLPLLHEQGASTATLGRVRYVDVATIKLRTLLWPEPARDVETVLLVTNRGTGPE